MHKQTTEGEIVLIQIEFKLRLDLFKMYYKLQLYNLSYIIPESVFITERYCNILKRK
jgi:hypothetical protein